MRTKMWIYANEIVDSCERDYYYSSEQALALSCQWNLCANKNQYEFHMRILSFNEVGWTCVWTFIILFRQRIARYSHCEVLKMLYCRGRG